MKKQAVVINGVKMMKKGCKDVAGKYYPCSYSFGLRVVSKNSFPVEVNGVVTYPQTVEAVTIYAKDICIGLPVELNPVNNTEIQSDYFEKDRVAFNVGTPEYNALLIYKQD